MLIGSRGPARSRRVRGPLVSRAGRMIVQSRSLAVTRAYWRSLSASSARSRNGTTIRSNRSPEWPALSATPWLEIQISRLTPAAVAGKLAPSLFNEREGDVCCVMVVEGIHGTRRAAELIGAPLGTAGPFAPSASAHRRIRV